ncbi:MAG: OsmC family protein [Candidatus Omnitrophota bacterium]
MNSLKVSYKGGMAFEAVCGEHKIDIDLPKDKGGDDKGMAPPELLAASLGSCVGVYVVWYCRQAGIETTGCSIEVEWQVSNDKKSISAYEIKVHLPQAEPGRRAQAILEAARSCLIHNTLHGEPNIDISLGTS